MIFLIFFTEMYSLKISCKPTDKLYLFLYLKLLLNARVGLCFKKNRDRISCLLVISKVAMPRTGLGM